MLRELFSRDGVGTIITRESLEILRDARPDDRIVMESFIMELVS